MSDKQEVCCPWCKVCDFSIAVPPESDTIICPSCWEPCDWWADGDIGPGHNYYLTQKREASLAPEDGT